MLNEHTTRGLLEALSVYIQERILSNYKDTNMEKDDIESCKFEAGRGLVFYEILSMFLEFSKLENVSVSDVGLENLDIEKDILAPALLFAKWGKVERNAEEEKEKILVSIAKFKRGMPKEKAEDKYVKFTKLLSGILKDRGRDAKAAKLSVLGEEDDNFYAGRTLGYNEILSIFMQHAEAAYDIPLDELGLKDFDPDRDL